VGVEFTGEGPYGGKREAVGRGGSQEVMFNVPTKIWKKNVKSGGFYAVIETS
jgi:hypothetical protein